MWRRTRSLIDRVRRSTLSPNFTMRASYDSRHALNRLRDARGWLQAEGQEDRRLAAVVVPDRQEGRVPAARRIHMMLGAARVERERPVRARPEVRRGPVVVRERRRARPVPEVPREGEVVGPRIGGPGGERDVLPDEERQQVAD